MKSDLAIFEDYKIRRSYDTKTETWYFSIVDILKVLMEQQDHKRVQSYWTTLKKRLKDEGSEVVTKCDQLKLLALNDKNYLLISAFSIPAFFSSNLINLVKIIKY
jgi:hypothetical protein